MEINLFWSQEREHLSSNENLETDIGTPTLHQTLYIFSLSLSCSSQPPSEILELEEERSTGRLPYSLFPSSNVVLPLTNILHLASSSSFSLYLWLYPPLFYLQRVFFYKISISLFSLWPFPSWSRCFYFLVIVGMLLWKFSSLLLSLLFYSISVAILFI